jgi:hypothetical protein
MKLDMYNVKTFYVSSDFSANIYSKIVYIYAHLDNPPIPTFTGITIPQHFNLIGHYEHCTNQRKIVTRELCHITHPTPVHPQTVPTT